MSSSQVFGILGALTVVIVLFEMLRRHRLREKYAVIWFLLALGVFVIGLFPPVLVTATRLVGLEVPSNLLFFVASLILLGLTLQHSFELGQSEERIRTLAEEVALLRLRLDQVEARSAERAADE